MSSQTGVFLSLLLLLAAPLPAAAADLAAARALLEARKLPEAQAAFEKLAASDPRNSELQGQLGDLALRRDDHEKAVRHLEMAVALDPNSSRFHHLLGNAYGRTAQKASVFTQISWAKKCLRAYQRAVELDPGNVDAQMSLFEYYQQAPGIAGGGADKALAQATELKKIDPARGRVALARYYIGEKKYDLGLAEFDDALKANPDDYSALYQLGRFSAMTGQFTERGLASLRRCLELTSPPNQPGHAAAHWRIGNLLEKKSDLAGARAAYETALKLDPKFNPAAESLRKLPAAK